MASPRVGSGSVERSGGDPGRDAAAVEPEPGGCRSEVSGRCGGRAESVRAAYNPARRYPLGAAHFAPGVKGAGAGLGTQRVSALHSWAE